MILVRLLLVMLLSLTSLTAFALTISPVVVELSAVRPVASVTLTNTSAKAVTFQAETKSWLQDGVDQYEKTENLMVVPPIAEIEPGASQIFRITLRQPPPADREQAYRLIFEDITEETEVKAMGVVFRFRHDLPVFAMFGAAHTVPRLLLCAAPQGKACVRLNNDGNHHLKITKLVAEGARGVRQDIKAAETLLAGAWKQWTFDWPANYAGSLTVNAETSAGPLSIELPAERR
jgi:fimbrial chaperone protein